MKNMNKFESTKEKNNKLSPKKGLAIASLVLSIIGGYPILSVASVSAIIFGHLALHKIKKDPNTYTGKGLAITGLVLGYFGLVIGIVLGVLRGAIRNKLGY